ncbi:hypothetical protein FH715_11160 [Streptomyces sedi]|uniref:Uncharacterized protein n=1 Tax=Streptomyces sedi TaxID=555059 RepID=A0A5C4V6V6_9ACTN|nr:hypothetical protein FH715_11160 [Streptomyces sedi]
MARASEETVGSPITSGDQLAAWLSQQPPDDVSEPFTFTVDADLLLRLAPRRSEHVVCSGGVLVAAAGEISFTHRGKGWEADEITNQSTGYCPAPDSWAAIDTTLTTAGVGHPAGFTHVFVFRQCPHCGRRNIVRDDYFCCALCDGSLPL